MFSEARIFTLSSLRRPATWSIMGE